MEKRIEQLKKEVKKNREDILYLKDDIDYILKRFREARKVWRKLNKKL